MSKKNRVETKRAARRSHKRTVPTALPPLFWVLAGLAMTGVVITAYLTWLKLLGGHPAYCEVGSQCDLVQSSRYSTLLGLPLSAWGLMSYVVLLASLWRSRRKPSTWVVSVSVAGFGTGFSLYLTGVSIFEIQATCLYCLGSLGVVSTVFVILLFTRPDRTRVFPWGSWATGCLAVTLAVASVFHMHHLGLFDPADGPENPQLKALATHLETSGARFYGAFWCPRCQDQKTAFEASASRLPYVECTPSGRNGPRSIACVNNAIERYPTWIIGDRRVEGYLEPKTLAILSGFDWQGE